MRFSIGHLINSKLDPISIAPFSHNSAFKPSKSAKVNDFYVI